MDGKLLAQCLEKLRLSWQNEGNAWVSENETLLSNAVLRLNEDDFIFPSSFSAKTNIPIALGHQFLVLLMACGIIDHYSIPKFNDDVFLEESEKGFFSAAHFNLQDPSDFEPISPDELSIISAFKLRNK